MSSYMLSMGNTPQPYRGRQGSGFLAQSASAGCKRPLARDLAPQWSRFNSSNCKWLAGMPWAAGGPCAIRIRRWGATAWGV